MDYYFPTIVGQPTRKGQSKKELKVLIFSVTVCCVLCKAAAKCEVPLRKTILQLCVARKWNQQTTAFSMGLFMVYKYCFILLFYLFNKGTRFYWF